MNKTTKILALALLPLLGLTACSTGADSSSEGAMSSSKMMSDEHMMSGDKMMSEDKMMSGDKMMSEDKMMSDHAMSKDAMSGPGHYITLEEYKGAMDGAAMMKEEGRTVLFFNASWCPDCRAIKKALTADPSPIPGGVTIVDVDYDANTDLRQKYGVTMQHTFVEVDSSGEALGTWNSPSADDLLTVLAK